MNDNSNKEIILSEDINDKKVESTEKLEYNCLSPKSFS